MEHANPNLRSLLCFEKPMPNCSRQRLLKVLSDMGMGGQSDSVDCECFHGLNQLRYCELSGSLSSNRISFELFISGLKCVETLDFHKLLGHGDLPDDIWNVKTLRHVMLCYPYTSGPSSSANLRNMQTLIIKVKSEESWNVQLPKLPNVRNLDIEMERSFSWDLMAKFLGTLNHLTCLKLLGSEVSQKLVEMQRFPFYQNLQSLYIEEQYPSSNNKLSPVVSMFPIHVTKLTLVNLQFKVDPLPVLEKLRSLRALKLEGETVNRKMCCPSGGFPQLHRLRFRCLRNLEEWEINEGAMPVLKDVQLSKCGKLRMPLGLQYLSNVKIIEVTNCKEIERHQSKNSSHIVFYFPEKLRIALLVSKAAKQYIDKMNQNFAQASG